MGKNPRQHVVLIVVYTMAFISVAYIATLCFCVLKHLSPGEVLGALTHVGDSVTGALIAMLVRTSSDDPGKPTPTVITNDTAHPVPTEPQDTKTNPS